MEGVKLFKHQKKALKHLKGKKAYALFMEPGTGKTLVMIRRLMSLYRMGRSHKTLIVCPLAVVPNWVSEINKFWSSGRESTKLLIWDSKGKNKADYKNAMVKEIKNTDKILVVINYDKMRSDKKLLLKCGFDTIVFDESQVIRNRNAQVTKAAHLLAKRCEYRYLMTGTPISTGYEDLYSQMLVMDESILGTRWRDFQDKYCQMGGFAGKQIVDYNNLNILLRKVREHSFKVKKNECVDLPPVIEHRLYCELSPKARKAYKELDNDLISLIEGYNLLNHHYIKNATDQELIALDSTLVKSMKLQQITGGFVKNTDTGNTLMIDQGKINLLKDVVNKHKGESIVIFCKFRAEIDMIKSIYPKATELSGHTKDKGKPVEDFQSGKTNMIIVQLKTGSAGINLTKGSVCVYYSWSGSYIDMRQSKDRLDRIGQVNKINLYYLIARDTIDGTSLQVLARREKMAEEIK